MKTLKDTNIVCLIVKNTALPKATDSQTGQKAIKCHFFGGARICDLEIFSLFSHECLLILLFAVHP